MDSDAVARHLLTATAARDVEIVAHNLEEAFLALTGDDRGAVRRRGGRRTERGMSARTRARPSRRMPRFARVPPLGGFNLTFLAIEIRRLLRNRRTVVVTLVVPVVLFLLFKSNRRAAPWAASN